jgi:hypothetical protein
LCIVCLARREQGSKGVVTRQEEAGGIDQELAGDIKEDEEEIEGAEAEDNVDLGHRGLLLDVVEHRVFRQLEPRWHISHSTCKGCSSTRAQSAAVDGVVDRLTSLSSWEM